MLMAAESAQITPESNWPANPPMKADRISRCASVICMLELPLPRPLQEGGQQETAADRQHQDPPDQVEVDPQRYRVHLLLRQQSVGRQQDAVGAEEPADRQLEVENVALAHAGFRRLGPRPRRFVDVVHGSLLTAAIPITRRGR